jgi:predicted AlkP superfamily pyrophosphatase or phosphodiesterase
MADSIIFAFNYIASVYTVTLQALHSYITQSHPQHQGGNLNLNSIYNSNEPSLKDLVLSQAKIIDNFKEKLKTNDKILELMNSKIEGLTSSIKNQLSFNKRIETQLAQFTATILVTPKNLKSLN